MASASFCKHRLSIITGHYGTGKTEFSVNLALALAHDGEQVMVADLDVVNPYFRSRERRAMLEEAGIQLISSSQSCANADVPSLPAEVFTILQNQSLRGVMDIGGDPVGARVLARFQPQIVAQDYQLIYVLNANRPEVREVEDAIRYLRDIEATTGLTCTGIVNNTHLCGETTEEEIRKGAELASALSAETGIPVLCHVAVEHLAENLSDLSEPVFPITIKMKKPWE